MQNYCLSCPLPSASCFLSPAQCDVHIVVVQHILHRGVAGDVVADGEEETGVLFADGHTAFHFGADLRFGAGEQDTRVGVADKDVGFAVFVGDILPSIRGR